MKCLCGICCICVAYAFVFQVFAIAFKNHSWHHHHSWHNRWYCCHLCCNRWTNKCGHLCAPMLCEFNCGCFVVYDIIIVLHKWQFVLTVQTFSFLCKSWLVNYFTPVVYTCFGVYFTPSVYLRYCHITSKFFILLPKTYMIGIGFYL